MLREPDDMHQESLAAQTLPAGLFAAMASWSSTHARPQKMKRLQGMQCSPSHVGETINEIAAKGALQTNV